MIVVAPCKCVSQSTKDVWSLQVSVSNVLSSIIEITVVSFTASLGVDRAMLTMFIACPRYFFARLRMEVDWTVLAYAAKATALILVNSRGSSWISRLGAERYSK